jgi:TfoX/Sxy family transcriptional regulator of competence genes
MGHDDELAERVRGCLSGIKRTSEREMFGELTFLVNGNVCCGVLGDDLVVRVDPTLYHDALTRPYARETGATGRAVRGVVYVGRDGLVDDAELDLWVRLGLARARSLPPKPVKKPRRKRT